MSYRITLEEQETFVRLHRIGELAYVESTDSTMLTKLRNLLEAEGTEWRLIEEDKYGMLVSCPKNLISFRTRTKKMKKTKKEKKGLE